MIRKKIGIWGFGISGQATTQFLCSQGNHVSVFDTKNISPETIDYFKKNNIEWYGANQFDAFIDHNDLIIPSPGINITPYSQYQYKWLPELDLFFNHYTKPIIAITGSIGKTSITTILAHLLQQLGKKIQIGGNIGIGLCDLLTNQNSAEYAVLEVSSFQLELSKVFAPLLSIWTNLYPNHLDRHETMSNYFNAKLKILMHQTHNQMALIPFDLYKENRQAFENIATILHFFSPTKPSVEKLSFLRPNSYLYYINDDKKIVKYHHTYEEVVSTSSIPSFSYPENWLIVTASLNILGCQLPETISLEEKLEHRLEKIETFNEIDIYNDSKSTIMESTIAAVKELNNRPILLLIGGISKGTDRSTTMKQLQDKNIKHIFCFGKEALQLQSYAQAYGLNATAYEQLDQAVLDAFSYSKNSDQILFSPGGASFDLFTDYKHRGNYFKNLIKNQLAQQRS